MSKTILLADDSVTIQKVIELTFMDEDYEVVAASNGDEAIEKLGEIEPDIVITDVHMPGADGYVVAQRSKELRPSVPVLLLVGTFEPFDEEKAELSGADRHLKKPFDSQELQRQVDELLASAGEATAVAEAEATAEADEVSDAVAADPAPTLTTGFSVIEDADADSMAADFGADEIVADAGTEASLADDASRRPAGEISEEVETELPSLDVVVEEVPAAALESVEEIEIEAAPMEDVEPISGAATQGAETVLANVVSPIAEPTPAAGLAEAAEAETVTDDESDADSEVTAAADGAEEIEVEAGSGVESSFAFVDAPTGGTEVVPPIDEAEQAAVAEIDELDGQGLDESAVAVVGGLSDDDVERIAQRVAEIVGDRVVQSVAWEVVPDLAEILIRDRLRELEGQVD